MYLGGGSEGDVVVGSDALELLEIYEVDPRDRSDADGLITVESSPDDWRELGLGTHAQSASGDRLVYVVSTSMGSDVLVTARRAASPPAPCSRRRCRTTRAWWPT